MTIFGRMKSAWGGFWGGNGFFPVSGGDAVASASKSVGNDKNMGIAAYFACIRNISEDIAKLPLITYRRLPNDKGKERATNNPIYGLLRYSPHPAYGAFAFRETMTRNALGRGNAFAEILRNNDGSVNALEILDPITTATKPAKDGTVSYIRDFLGSLDSREIPSANIIHIHGLSNDGIDGMSVAQYAAETLSFAQSSQSYGEKLFSRGARPGGVLTHPGKMKDDAKKKLAETWDKAYGNHNSGKTAILDNEIEYKPITISPVDAQYLETRQFTVEEIARWFRMPLHKIQYLVRAQGWSTLDAQNTDYLTDTLLPWLTRWEEELNRKLFVNDQDYFAEHLVDALLRGDQTTRTNAYVKEFSMGVLSINEIRKRENMNPIDDEGGDTHFVPLNMTPAEFAKSISGKEEKTNDT